MAWASPRTWTALEIVSASILNTHLRDNMNFLGGLKRNATALAALAAASSLAPHTTLIEVTHSSTQSISNSTTPTTISFNTDTYDADGFHDTATNNNRLTVPAGFGGLYYIFFSGVISAAGADVDRGQTGCIIRVNGEAISEKNHATVKWSASPNSRGACANALVYQLAAGDYVDFQVWQLNLSALSMSLLNAIGFLAAGLWKLKD